MLLKYENAEVVIETKVDTAENEYDDGWQTERIYRKYRRRGSDQFFVYLTYGASEYYVRKKDDGSVGTGPVSSAFRHVKLDDVILLLRDASGAIARERELECWLRWLTFEQSKRDRYADFLGPLTDFLALYKGGLNLTDVPNNRVNISAPEFFVIHFYRFAQEWNSLGLSDLKHVELYPVGRQGRVNDIVLNFRGLWDSSVALSFGGSLKNLCGWYFEINEDGNLHLKIEPNAISQVEHARILDFLRHREGDLSCGTNCTTESYKQWSYVVFEWDLGLLEARADLGRCALKAAEIMRNAIRILK